MFMDLISIIQEKIHIVIVKRVLIRLLFHQKNRFAMIKEVEEEIELINILQLLKDKDII